MWFQKIPITGFFANLVAVPWVSLVVVPLVLTGILMVNISSTLGTLCLLLAANAIELLWPFLEWLSSLDLNYWIPSPSFGVLLLSLIGILVLLQPAGLPGRWIGMIWLFPFFFQIRINLIMEIFSLPCWMSDKDYPLSYKLVDIY